MSDDRRNLTRSWSALIMSVVGLVGGGLSLLAGGHPAVVVCLAIVGLCGIGLLNVIRREGPLRLR